MFPAPLGEGVRLQPRIHWLAFKREHAKDTLVNTSQRLALNEALEAFDAQGELPERKRAFARKSPLAQPLKMLRKGVLRPVDNPQIFAPSALNCRLEQTTRAGGDESRRLDHSALTATLG